MLLEYVIGRMTANAQAIQVLLSATDTQEARWKAKAEEWSLVEIARHLLDEEREDFRVRLDLCLHKPGSEWPPIDPAGWVQARNYQDADLTETLALFADERRTSLDWLAGLRGADWNTANHHPVFGSMRAGDLLCAWQVHDVLHIRQIARMQHAYASHIGQPFGNDYAGSW